jgi:hypothetical protein
VEATAEDRHPRRIVTPVAFVAIVFALITSGAATAITAVAPTVLCHAILLMKLPNDPTIISIVGVTLVEDAVSVSHALVALGVVSTEVLLLGLHREDSSLLALGVLRLGLRQRCLWQIVHALALAHLSAISKSLTIEASSSFMDNFSFVLMLVTPVENAEMTSLLEI